MKMKTAKNNRRLFLVILCFLLLAAAVFCGIEILREHNSRKKDIENFAELAKLAEIPDSGESRYMANKETKSEDDADATSRRNPESIQARFSTTSLFLSV